MNQMEVSFSASLDNENFARTTVGAFLTPLNPTIDEIIEFKTIVAEGVSNAIIHGYNHNPECMVVMKVQIEDRQVKLIIQDYGKGIENLDQVKTPFYTTAKDLEHAGMGMTIIETLAETLDLLVKVRSGDEQAKEQVVKDNLGLVWSIVHRFKNSYYDKEDLFQIGCIGLMKAINHFDPSYNVQFSTYAVPIIMGEIKRYFRDDGTIKVSRSLKELNIKVTKAKEILQAENNEEPTVEEVARYLEVDVHDVVEAIDSSYYPTSLSEPIYEKDGSTISMEDRLIDKSDHMWFEKIALEMEMEKLDEKEKMIIYMRYQLDYNQEAIAQRLGISQVQVSRLEKKIVTKLRTRLKDGG